ncbi:PASTA domain-containing protein [uncultured Enterococcus sp.]|uniref:PASTA domain-containing protein n=1 Tax=uncultured Enterococcus sp. TaxID=167972 RepID=UPI002AA83344|nr:PASTA domain-containing protein [uncultured Enterococcus sp.]
MSDFLSNFQGGNYEKTRQDKLYEKNKEKQKASAAAEKKSIQHEEQSDAQPELEKQETRQSADKYADLSVEELLRIKKQERKARQARREAEEQEEELETARTQPVQQKAPVKAASPTRQQHKAQPRVEPQPERSSSVAPGEELTEIDPSYRRKKIIKYVVLAVIAIAVIIGGYFTYYQFTHVEVPDFTGEELSDARTWSAENDVVLKVEQVYDFDKETNQIISQSVTKKKIKKGSELTINASLGPDPEENIPLPDFNTMAAAALKEWIVTNKADNLSVIEENNETKAAGEFIKLEMVSKDVTAETYKRKDKAKVYYSKGAEVLEKTIEVPDFAGKTKEEVEEWTKKNELTIQTSESNSDTVESGKVISQEIGKGTKVAKKDKFPVVISIGKAYVVPDFSHLTMEEAEGNADNVSVKQIYNDNVPYGGFISQSVEAGLSFKEAERPAIQLVYSIGKPFMRDLRNSTLEGEIQKVFYEEYQSKGAGITYQVYYVDSAVTKGTVVEMSQYNEFVATNAVIRLGVSRGNIQNQDAAADNNAPQAQDGNTDNE